MKITLWALGALLVAATAHAADWKDRVITGPDTETPGFKVERYAMDRTVVASDALKDALVVRFACSHPALVEDIVVQPTEAEAMELARSYAEVGVCATLPGLPGTPVRHEKTVATGDGTKAFEIWQVNVEGYSVYLMLTPDVGRELRKRFKNSSF